MKSHQKEIQQKQSTYVMSKDKFTCYKNITLKNYTLCLLDVNIKCSQG